MTNKGQAMIEALAVGALLMVSFLLTLRYALTMQNNLLVDESIEQTLLCEAEGNSTCKDTLRAILQKLQFRNIMIHTEKHKNKFKLIFNGVSNFEHKYEKESELDLELTYIP